MHGEGQTGVMRDLCAATGVLQHAVVGRVGTEFEDVGDARLQHVGEQPDGRLLQAALGHGGRQGHAGRRGDAPAERARGHRLVGRPGEGDGAGGVDVLLHREDRDHEGGVGAEIRDVAEVQLRPGQGVVADVELVQGANEVPVLCRERSGLVPEGAGKRKTGTTDDITSER